MSWTKLVFRASHSSPKENIFFILPDKQSKSIALICTWSVKQKQSYVIKLKENIKFVICGYYVINLFWLYPWIDCMQHTNTVSDSYMLMGRPREGTIIRVTEIKIWASSDLTNLSCCDWNWLNRKHAQDNVHVKLGFY